METKIKAILKYQKEKSELIKKHTRVELIPSEVKLTEEFLSDEGVLSTIIDNFAPAGKLASFNCIHCIVYSSHCNMCEYKTKFNSPCENDDSIFSQAQSKYDELTEKDDTLICELNRLGENLIKALEI